LVSQVRDSKLDVFKGGISDSSPDVLIAGQILALRISAISFFKPQAAPVCFFCDEIVRGR
jgi:hypothetical protein